jgi:cation diffusion facilitator family transporter
MAVHNHDNNHISIDNKKKTLFVIIVTVITMAFEIIYGYLTHSMALFADGWHMGTHALALSITFLAFVFVEKFSNSPYFPNGTSKISPFAGFLSSLFLAFTGFCVIIESFFRFVKPLQIAFNTAVLVAVIGLVVNGVCLLIMESKDKNSDCNYMAAYLHILADALTSVFAIVALLAGKYFGLIFLDPLMGIVGGCLILSWAFSLIKRTTIVLLDMEKPVCQEHCPDEHNHCFTH